MGNGTHVWAVSTSIFHEMGIKSGDVITRVNDNTIATKADGLKLYQSLQSYGNIKLQLKRRGRLETIDYYIE